MTACCFWVAWGLANGWLVSTAVFAGAWDTYQAGRFSCCSALQSYQIQWFLFLWQLYYSFLPRYSLDDHLSKSKHICFNKYQSPKFGALWSSCQCLPSLLSELLFGPPDCLQRCSVHLLPLFPLLYLLCLICFTWSWSGGSSKGALFCFLSYSPLYPSGVSQVHSSTALVLVLNVGRLAYFTSESPRVPQVILPWIFCSLPHATNPKPSISLPFCTGAPTVVFLWSFLRYSIVSSFF